MSADAPLGPEDQALLERLAARVVELHLEVPAILALESARPLRVVAAQGLLFFEPFVQALFPLPEWRRWSELAARPDAMESLLRAIEARADAGRPAGGASR